MFSKTAENTRVPLLRPFVVFLVFFFRKNIEQQLLCGIWIDADIYINLQKRTFHC